MPSGARISGKARLASGDSADIAAELKKTHARLKMPLPDPNAAQLFPSLESLYKAARSSLFSFLKKFRKARVRSARGSRKRSAVSSFTTGRNIRVVNYVRGRHRIAPMQTILKSVSNGHYDLRKHRTDISKSDLVGWHRTEYESLTLILLVDVSKSTWPFIEMFKDILGSLTGYFNRHDDRVGLISLQGLQAKIMNHPTRNFRVIARGLGKLKFHGESPVGDGLLKALAMARLERSKNPGSRSIVILLSDCYPEPVTRGLEDLFKDPMYRSALNTASTYRRAGVMLLVVNPAFEAEESTRPGEVLAERMVQASGGKLIKLIRPAGRKHERPTPSELTHIQKTIENLVIK